MTVIHLSAVSARTEYPSRSTRDGQQSDAIETPEGWAPECTASEDAAERIWAFDRRPVPCAPGYAQPDGHIALR